MEKNEKAMNTRSMIVGAALALLSGCASTGTNPAQEAMAREPLLCKDKVQCDFYWQRAQVWVAQNSTFRIQSATDTVISTYGPLRADPRFAYQIIKVPRADGGAQITIQAACDNMFGCSQNLYAQIVQFKNFVQFE